ncbi:hypothetical protein A5724_17865 [Mycobacterium sp. ACS1612]|nr:hypothetical protein A5724_17865 [Mycobacterium sp. ACS1612]
MKSVPIGCSTPWRGHTSTDAVSPYALAVSQSSASSTSSSQRPVMTASIAAGVTADGSRPASEAADRTTSRDRA